MIRKKAKKKKNQPKSKKDEAKPEDESDKVDESRILSRKPIRKDTKINTFEGRKKKKRREVFFLRMKNFIYILTFKRR